MYKIDVQILVTYYYNTSLLITFHINIRMLPTYIIMINQSYQSLPNKLSSSKGNTDKFYDKLYAFAARGF